MVQYVTNNSPVAFLAKNNGRLKMFSEKTYLNENEEFQIELFNPSSVPVQAKIKLNGKLISEKGLVLNPGQRFFLDRFIDEAKKFKFETYEVENFEGVEKALVNNGLVEVLFYSEVITPSFTLTVNNTNLNSGLYQKFNEYPYPYYTYQTNGILGQPVGQTVLRSSSNNSTFTNSVNSTYYSSTNFSNSATTPQQAKGLAGDKVETGRIAEGSKSDQKFKEVNLNFNSYTSAVYKFQILPNSQKPVHVTDLVVSYCQSCGVKQKNGNIFCPKCGTKL